MAERSSSDESLQRRSPKDERDSSLINFEKCARSLAQWLDEEPPLSAMEQISLENHLHVIHLSYGAWKRKQSGDDQGKGGSRSDA